jgi:hypothetical protein
MVAAVPIVTARGDEFMEEAPSFFKHAPRTWT